MKRTTRLRLRPRTALQKLRLKKHADAVRFLHNKTVERLQKQYEETSECDWHWKGYSKHITALREQYHFLRQVSSYNIRASTQSISTQYQNFFKRQGCLPKFHSRFDNHCWFPLATHNVSFTVAGKNIKIQKIGTMRMTGDDLYAEHKTLSGTVKKEGKHWYCYLVREVPEHLLKQGGDGKVGIDRNINNFTLSTGKVYIPPLLKNLRERKRQLQRSMSRRFTKGNKSSRYLQAKNRHQAVSAKIARVLYSWTHHITREIADEFGLVVLEDLDIQKMTRHDGNYKKKMNNGMLNSCWGLLDRQLSYKAVVEKVNPAYTSQDCSKCGNRGVRDKDSFKCVCGFEANADYNASLNILSGWEYPTQSRQVAVGVEA